MFEKTKHSFNSRTRVGATYNPADIHTFLRVSIHAPVWVRPGTDDFFFIVSLFQFTHPCGCDNTIDIVQ